MIKLALTLAATLVSSVSFAQEVASTTTAPVETVQTIPTMSHGVKLTGAEMARLAYFIDAPLSETLDKQFEQACTVKIIRSKQFERACFVNIAPKTNKSGEKFTGALGKEIEFITANIAALTN